MSVQAMQQKQSNKGIAQEIQSTSSQHCCSDRDNCINMSHPFAGVKGLQSGLQYVSDSKTFMIMQRVFKQRRDGDVLMRLS